MKFSFKKISSFPAPFRILCFLMVLLLMWLPIALPIQLIFRDNQNLVTIVTMGWLFILFFWFVNILGKQIYQQDTPYQNLGLMVNVQNGQDGIQGLLIGLILTFSLFLIQGGLGWLQWQENSLPWWQLITEGALTGMGVAIAEEAVFRGWLLNELERDYSPVIALWANGIIFAIAHFFKPIAVILETLPAFPGLVLLGMILARSRRKKQGRLGLAIGLHGGLVWGYYIVNVGELIDYTNQVSPAITGIYGNPIAGVMGWIFLLGLMFWLSMDN